MLHCLRLQNKNCQSVRFTWRFRTILKHHTNQLHSSGSPSYNTQCQRQRKPIHLISRNRMHSTSGTLANRFNETKENNAPGLYESNALPSKAQTVICGGGIMGAAVAYHLALNGLGHEVVVLEQDRFVYPFVQYGVCVCVNFFDFMSRIGGGMTWHSSGLVGAFKPTYSQVLLAQQTIKLYDDLNAQGLKTGWKQCGSLNVARTRDRMTQFRRQKALST